MEVIDDGSKLLSAILTTITSSQQLSGEEAQI